MSTEYISAHIGKQSRPNILIALNNSRTQAICQSLFMIVLTITIVPCDPFPGRNLPARNCGCGENLDFSKGVKRSIARSAKASREQNNDPHPTDRDAIAGRSSCLNQPETPIAPLGTCGRIRKNHCATAFRITCPLRQTLRPARRIKLARRLQSRTAHLSFPLPALLRASFELEQVG